LSIFLRKKDVILYTLEEKHTAKTANVTKSKKTTVKSTSKGDSHPTRKRTRKGVDE
jgi:hypothetical protein